MKRMIFFLILLIIFNGRFNQALARETLNLDDLLNEGIKTNPELKELSSKLEAAKLREPQESSLEDPMFGFGFMNVPLNVLAFGSEMMTAGEISLSQKVPYPEKLSLKGSMARIMAGIDQQMLFSKINEIKKEIKMDFYEIYFVNKTIEITGKNKGLLRDFVKIAETKYMVGQGNQQDIIRAGVEQSKLSQKLIVLEQQKEILKIKLKYHLGNPDFKLDKEPGIIKLSVINLSEPELEKISLNKQPELKVSEINISFSQSENRMAKLEYIPDFDFMLSYGFKPDRADMVSGKLSVNLPFWYKNRQDNRVKETENLIKENTEAFNSRKNEIITGIRTQIIKIKSQEKLYGLLVNGIIPQSGQYLKSAVIGYQAGKIDYLALQESLAMLLDYEMQTAEILTEHEKSIAELEFMIGSELVRK